MAFRFDRNRRPAAPAAAAVAPTAGLGGALAALPPPWVVFRQSGFSAFDNASSQIYGGLYVALHPQMGIALVDLAPAQPEKAIPRLRSLLQAAGKPEFAADAPAIVACALARDDVAAVGTRLAEIFAATPGEPIGADWTDAAAAALTARLPELKRVRHSAGALPPAPAAARPQKAAAMAPPLTPPSPAP
ncbi:MAG TPA: hypothetical protein VMU85_05835, partial [Stellaceae bacterium]|nr:hypothetical protein [Stellaceae bacterium]